LSFQSDEILIRFWIANQVDNISLFSNRSASVSFPASISLNSNVVTDVPGFNLRLKKRSDRMKWLSLTLSVVTNIAAEDSNKQPYCVIQESG